MIETPRSHLWFGVPRGLVPAATVRVAARDARTRLHRFILAGLCRGTINFQPYSNRGFRRLRRRHFTKSSPLPDVTNLWFHDLLTVDQSRIKFVQLKSVGMMD